MSRCAHEENQGCNLQDLYLGLKITYNVQCAYLHICLGGDFVKYMSHSYLSPFCHIHAEQISTKIHFLLLVNFSLISQIERQKLSETHTERKHNFSFNLSLVPMESSPGYVRLDLIIARAHTCTHKHTHTHV